MMLLIGEYSSDGGGSRMRTEGEKVAYGHRAIERESARVTNGWGDVVWAEGDAKDRPSQWISCSFCDSWRQNSPCPRCTRLYCDWLRRLGRLLT